MIFINNESDDDGSGSRLSGTCHLSLSEISVGRVSELFSFNRVNGIFSFGRFI